MKKTLIRGVALILAVLSILVLASACKWYNTTYEIKKIEINGNNQNSSKAAEDLKGKKVKVSLNKIITNDEKYDVHIYMAPDIINCDVTVNKDGEFNECPKYVGSKNYHGSNIKFTFYKASNRETNTLKIEYKDLEGNLLTTLYSYD